MDRTYYFTCKNPQEREKWISSIGRQNLYFIYKFILGKVIVLRNKAVRKQSIDSFM